MNFRALLTVVFLVLVGTSGVSAKEGKGQKKPKHREIPPGLEKKIERGKSLPPGWQKKLKVGHVIDKQVYRHATIVVPVNRDGSMTVEIDGRLLRLAKKTREILEILK